MATEFNTVDDEQPARMPSLRMHVQQGRETGTRIGVALSESAATAQFGAVSGQAQNARREEHPRRGGGNTDMPDVRSGGSV